MLSLPNEHTHRHCEERGTNDVAISQSRLEIASLNPLAMTVIILQTHQKKQPFSQKEKGCFDV
jgi:hypothetical protein